MGVGTARIANPVGVRRSLGRIHDQHAVVRAVGHAVVVDIRVADVTQTVGVGVLLVGVDD